MQKYAVIEKYVGETPLQATVRLREKLDLSNDIPLAYAGRLDPMASGKLLILIGDECKKQKKYHGLDKQYEFEVLFGFRSDTGDVLGIAEKCGVEALTRDRLEVVARELVGPITLPYPHFSSKTVNGKPLHIWTLENRLHEIEVPTKESSVYTLSLLGFRTITSKELFSSIHEKIDTIMPVTEASKELGRDFRRHEVHARWQELEKTSGTTYIVATFSARVSSGTYIRSLSEVIGNRLDTYALAYAIHRSKVGKYLPLIGGRGVWVKQF